MYEIDRKDRVAAMTDIPAPEAGAPCPIVYADEHRLLLAYYTDRSAIDPDGVISRETEPESADTVAVGVRIAPCFAHVFGPPNDETLAGHPLAARGLASYGVFEVQSSSWLRRLERLNSVHSQHDTKRYMEGKRHFIFTFHDSTLECIAHGLECRISECSVKTMIQRLMESES